MPGDRRAEHGSDPDPPARPASTREVPLSDLIAALDPAANDHPDPPDAPGIRTITTSSDDAAPGSLFVALRGTSTDGHDFIGEAVANGAVAVVAEAGYRGDPGVPVVRVPDGRKAVARLAAAWHGQPADRLRLVGITGSLGKTSTLAMLEAILLEAGVRAGTIGSLGLHVDGETVEESGHTAPDPLSLHRQLARLVDEGCGTAAMEVTSHGLVQERVHGLSYDLGIFTNLVPLEHSEYHPTFRDYAEAKARFFDHLRDGAPLLYNVDDLVVRRLVHDACAEPVGIGAGRAAVARIQACAMDAEGSRFELDVRRPLPRTDGGDAAPTRIPLTLRLLGHTNVANAGLAATAALCLGVDPAPIRRALAALPRQPRRMEILHRGPFTILDDTVGHPDSISGVLRVVREFAPRRVHVVFAVRGQRGERVNRHSATTLAVWSRRIPLETLVLTSSEDAADERNRVDRGEREACEAALRENGVAFGFEPRLEDAVRSALDAVAEGDMVLLLGAQGMDQGREVVRQWLDPLP